MLLFPVKIVSQGAKNSDKNTFTFRKHARKFYWPWFIFYFFFSQLGHTIYFVFTFFKLSDPAKSDAAEKKTDEKEEAVSKIFGLKISEKWLYTYVYGMVFFVYCRWRQRRVKWKISLKMMTMMMTTMMKMWWWG